MSVYLDGRHISTSAELVELYAERIAAFGVSSVAMFYASEEQHVSKLQAFSEAAATVLRSGESVLEIGSGYGQLLNYCSVPGTYLGVELVLAFVEEARRRHPSQRFVHADIMNLEVGSWDWVLMPGVLSAVPQPKMLLRRAIDIAQLGVLFDVTVEGRLPSSYRDLNRWQLSDAYRFIASTGFQATTMADRNRSWVILAATPKP